MLYDYKASPLQWRTLYFLQYPILIVQWTTRITETGITNLTRIKNEVAASSDYLMEYFNGILAVLLE